MLVAATVNSIVEWLRSASSSEQATAARRGEKGVL